MPNETKLEAASITIGVSIGLVVVYLFSVDIAEHFILANPFISNHDANYIYFDPITSPH